MTRSTSILILSSEMITMRSSSAPSCTRSASILISSLYRLGFDLVLCHEHGAELVNTLEYKVNCDLTLVLLHDQEVKHVLKFNSPLKQSRSMLGGVRHWKKLLTCHAPQLDRNLRRRNGNGTFDLARRAFFIAYEVPLLRARRTVTQTRFDRCTIAHQM